MERLTNECWRNFDPWEMCGQDHYCKRGCHELGGCTKGCIVPKVYCRLAAYEDTGLEPERVAELAQAEKVGDILYEVDLPEYGVITCKVFSISYYNGPMFHVPGNEEVGSLTIEVEVIDGHGKGSSYNFEIEDFGKHVFLTREEAETALREAAGNA